MSEQNIWEERDGWYHRDECEDKHGPFKTKQEAEEALTKYVKWLDGAEKKANE